jgi:hypothetical protein
MSGFARRTGLYPVSPNKQRYLWTDAFAICNFLELFTRTNDDLYRRCAMDLIDQVHHVLGRYRADDYRHGWISGLSEEYGERHPTLGGLRIGKPLKEREPLATHRDISGGGFLEGNGLRAGKRRAGAYGGSVFDGVLHGLRAAYGSQRPSYGLPLAKRAQPHLSGLAPQRIPQEPGFRVLASDLQIKPRTVRVHSRYFELLNLGCGELIDSLGHPSTPDLPTSSARIAANQREWAGATFRC